MESWEIQAPIEEHDAVSLRHLGWVRRTSWYGFKKRILGLRGLLDSSNCWSNYDSAVPES